MNFKSKNYQKLNNELIERIKKVKEKEQKIQEKFNFIIPDYVLNEIVETEDNPDPDNINALINLAIVNNRINKRNAKILKKYFVFNI